MKFISEFWHVLNNPQEWSTGSIIAVGIAFYIMFAISLGPAIDDFLGF